MQERADRPAEEGTASPTAARSDLVAWQSKLLPLMGGLLLALAAFFMIATLTQAARMQERIEQVGRPIPSIADAAQEAAAGGLSLDRARLDARTRLEQYAIESRYQQAGLILMARVWIIYLGFITGMILALVGAAFILGKLQEPASQLEAESSALKVSIATASPGLILAVLGSVLMVTTIAIRAEVKVIDKPLYLTPEPKVVGVSMVEPPAPTPEVDDAAASEHRSDAMLDDLDAADERLSSDDAESDEAREDP